MKIAKTLTVAAGIIACALAPLAQTPASGESEIKEQKIKFSATAFNPGGKQPYASISGDGKTLSLECTGIGKKNWPTLFKSKEGFFRHSTDYRISFSYIIHNIDEGAAFLLRVREIDSASSEVLRARLEKKDDFQYFSARFRTPANAKKLILMLTAAEGSMSVEIKDMKIEYGAFEEYVPATAKAEAFDVSEIDAPLPTGAKEFVVDLPQGNGSSISIEHLDVEPGLAFMASKINQAIKICRERGISKLTLPKAVYYIDEDNAIKLENLKDFEIDGSGSTFVFKRRKGPSVSIQGCERVKLSNINFDWDWDKDPLGAFVKVGSIRSSEKESFVDFTFVDYREYPLQYVRIACLSQVDESTRSVGVENGRTYMWETWSTNPPKEKKWISPNVLRVYLSKKEAEEFTKGEFFRMTHYYYDMNCVAMGNNRHLTLENINVYSTPGHAFTVDGKQQYWHFKNVNIVRPQEDPKRAITCTADHLHIARSQGFFKMEDCDFSFGNDDCMNAHDNSAHVKKLDKNSVYMTKKWEARTYRVGEQIEFRNTDMSPTGYIGEVVDVAEITKRPGNYRISFKTDIPEDIDEFVLFNRTYDTSNIIVRNCTFRQNRARGLLILARNVTVENCKFYRNEMGAIKMESGWTETSWSEGFGVDNVVVRNCEFDTVNPSGMMNDGKIRDIFMGAYIKTDPSKVQTHYPVIQNVLFEKNRFKDSFGTIAFISSAKNITFKDNVFTNETARNSEAYYRGAFFVTHSQNVNIINNTYIDSRLLKRPGVMYEKENSENITAAGNTIAKTEQTETKTVIPEAPKEREYNVPTVPSFFSDF